MDKSPVSAEILPSTSKQHEASTHVEKSEANLLKCIKKNDLEGVFKLLEESSFLVNFADANGNTILHKAISETRNPQILAALIEKGVDVNSEDNHGNTALHLACHDKKDYAEIICMLLFYGANARIVNHLSVAPFIKYLGVQWNTDPAIARILLDHTYDSFKEPIALTDFHHFMLSVYVSELELFQQMINSCTWITYTNENLECFARDLFNFDSICLATFIKHFKYVLEDMIEYLNARMHALLDPRNFDSDEDSDDEITTIAMNDEDNWYINNGSNLKKMADNLYLLAENDLLTDLIMISSFKRPLLEFIDHCFSNKGKSLYEQSDDEDAKSDSSLGSDEDSTDSDSDRHSNVDMETFQTEDRKVTSYEVLKQQIDFGTGVVLNLLSHGLFYLNQTFLNNIYHQFGYCELFRILLHCDLGTSEFGPSAMAKFIYDEDYTVDYFLQNNPESGMYDRVIEVMEFFAHPDLVQSSVFFLDLVNSLVRIVKGHQIKSQTYFPSLVELSRESAREAILQKVNGKFPSMFYTYIDHLHIPEECKDILAYKKKLYPNLLRSLF